MAAFPPYFSKRWLQEFISHVQLWERAGIQIHCIYSRYLSNPIEQNKNCVLLCSPFISHLLEWTMQDQSCLQLPLVLHLQKCLVKSNIPLQPKKEMMQQYIMYNCTQCKIGNWTSTALCYSVCWDLVSLHLSLLRNQVYGFLFYT